MRTGVSIGWHGGKCDQIVGRAGRECLRSGDSAVVGERDDDPPRALTSCTLPSILSKTWSCRRDGDDRHLLVDQRDRAVLHLASGIAFGVDVGDLLQLQRAFERDREVDTRGPDTGSRAAGRIAWRSPRSVGSHFSACFDQAAAAGERLECGRASSGVTVPRTWPRYSASRCKRHQLRGERLRRGHADLRPGVGVERAVALARRHAADHVADRDALRALPSALRASAASVSAVSPDCVMTIASVFGIHDRVAVAILRSVVHLHRQPRQLLDQELADQGRVPRRAAGEDDDVLARRAGSASVMFISSRNTRPVSTATRPSTVSRTARLLEDLLQHEVLVAGLLRHHRIPRDLLRRLRTPRGRRSR